MKKEQKNINFNKVIIKPQWHCVFIIKFARTR